MSDDKNRGLVKATLDSFVAQQYVAALPYQAASYLIQLFNRYQSGNFPELHGPAGLPVGDDDDWVLVQWCHGAPGMVLPLLQGFVNFKNEVQLLRVFLGILLGS